MLSLPHFIPTPGLDAAEGQDLCVQVAANRVLEVVQRWEAARCPFSAEMLFYSGLGWTALGFLEA